MSRESGILTDTSITLNKPCPENDAPLILRKVLEYYEKY